MGLTLTLKLQGAGWATGEADYDSYVALAHAIVNMFRSGDVLIDPDMEVCVPGLLVSPKAGKTLSIQIRGANPIQGEGGIFCNPAEPRSLKIEYPEFTSRICLLARAGGRFALVVKRGDGTIILPSGHRLRGGKYEEYRESDLSQPLTNTEAMKYAALGCAQNDTGAAVAGV